MTADTTSLLSWLHYNYATVPNYFASAAFF